MAAHITRFMDKAVSLAKETVVGRPAPALQRGDGGCAEWVLLAILTYKERETETYRSVVDKLKIMGPIREVLEVERDDIPQPSTLCKAMDALTMALLRALLEGTTTLFDLGDVAAIDGTSFDRIAASRRYTRRTDDHFLAMKTTLLTDRKTGAILDIHYTTSRPHDTPIGWQVLTRNRDRLRIITADKGYDWADLRSMLRDSNIRPLIKHRIFDSSTGLPPSNGHGAIDPTYLDRWQASTHYLSRCNRSVRTIQVTVLIDFEESAILDLHCSTKWPSGMRIGPKVVLWNADDRRSLAADKGYDDMEFHELLRAHNIRPLIKHRVFAPYDHAHNARIDDDLYHQRALTESTNSSLKRSHGEALRARDWFRQFREIAVIAGVYNVEQAIEA